MKTLKTLVIGAMAAIGVIKASGFTELKLSASHLERPSTVGDKTTLTGALKTWLESQNKAILEEKKPSGFNRFLSHQEFSSLVDSFSNVEEVWEDDINRFYQSLNDENIRKKMGLNLSELGSVLGTKEKNTQLPSVHIVVAALSMHLKSMRSTSIMEQLSLRTQVSAVESGEVCFISCAHISQNVYTFEGESLKVVAKLKPLKNESSNKKSKNPWYILEVNAFQDNAMVTLDKESQDIILEEVINASQVQETLKSLSQGKNGRLVHKGKQVMVFANSVFYQNSDSYLGNILLLQKMKFVEL